MYLNVYFDISLTAGFKTNLFHFILTSKVICARKQDLLSLTFRNRKLATTNFELRKQFITKII